MNWFIRYWNQNRMKVIRAILIIAFIIILIVIINSILKNNRPADDTSNRIIEDISIPDESVITGENISEEITKNNTDIIEQFVNFCNAKDYQSAYDLLTQECKDSLYNTLEIFISNYCNNIFTTEKTYSLELWYNISNSYTYKITYKENNLLQTGNINQANAIEDYITITEENDEYRINVNGFIDRENINKTGNNNNIEITVNYRNIYIDYEEYNIKIKNNTDKTILLSDRNDNNICLVDNNDTEYNSILGEILTENLEINSGAEKTLNIRFNKRYNLSRMIDSIKFKNIITDKDSYEVNSENANKLEINIKI